MSHFNFFTLMLLICCFIELKDCSGNFREGRQKVLSRKKRYVTFPDGSSFSCAGCITVGLIGQPAPTSTPGVFVFGLNWGIAYELPNQTESLRFFHQKYRTKYEPLVMRRSRRELYEKLEVIINKFEFVADCIQQWKATCRRDTGFYGFLSRRFASYESMGYNGRECILKALCETTQRLVPHGENVIEEMFRTLFTLPMAKVLPTEPIEHQIYDSAHRLGALLESCDKYKCAFSLVDLAKGYYNAPAPKSDPYLNPWSLLSSNFG